MFRRTHDECAPWIVGRANGQKRGRLEAMRFVPNGLDYSVPDPDPDPDPDRDPFVAGEGHR